MQKTAVRELPHVGVSVETVNVPQIHVRNENSEFDPFYSESNLAYLRCALTALNNGEGIEREIIEVLE